MHEWAAAPGTDGPAERRARAIIDRNAAVLRGLVGVSAGAFGLLGASPESAAVPVCAAVLAWAVARLLTVRHRTLAWTILDVLVAVAVGLSAPWTVTSADVVGQQGFVVMVVTAANVTLAWHARRGLALAACTAVTAAAVTGAVMATGQSVWTVPALYVMPLQAVLGWGLVGVFLPVAREADRAARERSNALADLDVAAARRAATWEHWSLLHDTAAATLMMVGDGAASPAADRIRRQAERDLRALDGLTGHHPTDVGEHGGLADAVRRCVADSPLTVSLAVEGAPTAPGEVVAVLVRAIRELLTNVERHAGAVPVQVLVREVRDGVVVVVQDQGPGFDPTLVRDGPGRGLRESVVGRLDRIGATALVDSATGAGTTITLTWLPSATATTPTDTSAVRSIRVPYLRYFGIALAVVTAVAVVQFAAVGLATDGAPPLMSAVLAALLLVATAAGGGRMARDRDWRPTVVGGWLGSVLVADVLFVLALRPADISRPANWALGAVPYVVVVLLTGRRPRWSVLAVAGAVLLDVVPLVAEGGLTAADVARFGQQVTLLTIFPLAAAVFYAGLLDVARTAATEDAERAALRSAERRAAALAADRAERAAMVSTTVVPLLEALADGRADPRDDRVQRSARVESARLRRIFAEHDEVDDPVVHEVRASVQASERAGVAATLDVHGAAPALPVQVRRQLLEAPMALLARAVDSARVVVDATDGRVAVSVVTRIPGFVASGSEESAGPVTVRSVAVGDQVWVQGTWEDGR
ncbi:hypothetical protein FDO65_01035 [Nakamurella flava]|uniref:Histidine kinase/HSP90-like ATPase domain-containing protein n=1 Tax=Nakamurella flava TaxID=2576308 RepID=A0A4U6QJS6_9ACTN|nr:ATP-binding protein [Nakamurella flava]TKV60336.1 hypothetical protein FDO65_01035 [Nakamurella flava]